MTFTSLLNDRVYLNTKYSSQNILGEWTYTYSSASTGTKCRVSPLSASERIDRTGLFDDVKYKCFCESGAAIATDNRVIYAGETYRVKESYLDSSFHHRTALLTKIT